MAKWKVGPLSPWERAVRWWNSVGPFERQERCVRNEDDIHCRCWYDGEGCCSCGAPAGGVDPETGESIG